MIWGTVGPLVEPSNRSGVHFTPSAYGPCTCDPTFGQSCRRCDGTGADGSWRIDYQPPAVDYAEEEAS